MAHAGPLAWALPFSLVGVPAFLMGGTLPVAIRASIPDRALVAGTGGVIYAANTAGGIAGAVLSSFVLVPWLGVLGAAFAAAALNASACIGALALGRESRGKQIIAEQPGDPSISKHVRLALTLYALAGGIALGYEVVWSQAIVQFLSTRTFAFSIVLATYLAGLVVGSAFYARFADRVRDPWGVFGILIAAAGLIAFFEIASLSLWQLQVQAFLGKLVLSATGSEFLQMCARFLIAAVGIVFLPTLLLGAAFPAALRIATGERSIGGGVGTVVGLNTAGGIAGTLLTGFILVPRFGLVHALGILAVLSAAVGTLAVLSGGKARSRLRWAVFAVAILTVAGIVLTPADRLGRLLPTTRGGGSLVFYEESQGGTVAVLQQRNASNEFRRLYIQGVSNSGDALPSLRYMRLQALLPVIIQNSDPHSALVIGFGTGITAGALTQYSQLKHTVCAELLPAVVRAAPLFRGNFDASTSSGLDIRIRDGRQELVRSADRYDLITLEPPPPSASGVVNLYSTDFYELASKRLLPKGLFAQWLPLTTQNGKDTRSLIRSFVDVFPYACLWTTELHEMLLIGSFSPIELDANRIATRFSEPRVAEALKMVGIASPAALLATWITDRDGLKRYAADAPPVTDNRPTIEYATWVHPNEITRVLPEILGLRTEPTLVGGEEAFRASLVAERRCLLDFYAAGIAAYQGDRRTWAENIVRVLKQDGENPYYRWAVEER